jgi:hypothetical protein
VSSRFGIHGGFFNTLGWLKGHPHRLFPVTTEVQLQASLRSNPVIDHAQVGIAFAVFT